MELEAEREALVRLAKRLRPDGLVTGTSGNLSARRGDLVAITPSGLDYDDLHPDLVCVVRLDGTPVDAELEPSTELPMHLAAYGRTPAHAVVHTHSSYATAVACSEAELPPVHYLVAEFGGPVRVAPYAPFGTPELAHHVARALEGRSAALLANHGTITIGDTLERAYGRSITLEWISALYVRSRALGTPRVLSDTEIDVAVGQISTYGQATTHRARR